MSVRRRTFLDSNVLVYLLTVGRKADLAESCAVHSINVSVAPV